MNKKLTFLIMALTANAVSTVSGVSSHAYALEYSLQNEAHARVDRLKLFIANKIKSQVKEAMTLLEAEAPFDSEAQINFAINDLRNQIKNNINAWMTGAFSAEREKFVDQIQKMQSLLSKHDKRSYEKQIEKISEDQNILQLVNKLMPLNNQGKAIEWSDYSTKKLDWTPLEVIRNHLIKTINARPAVVDRSEEIENLKKELTDIKQALDTMLTDKTVLQADKDALLQKKEELMQELQQLKTAQEKAIELEQEFETGLGGLMLQRIGSTISEVGAGDQQKLQINRGLQIDQEQKEEQNVKQEEHPKLIQKNLSHQSSNNSNNSFIEQENPQVQDQTVDDISSPNSAEELTAAIKRMLDNVNIKGKPADRQKQFADIVSKIDLNLARAIIDHPDYDILPQDLRLKRQAGNKKIGDPTVIGSELLYAIEQRLNAQPELQPGLSRQSSNNLKKSKVDSLNLENNSEENQNVKHLSIQHLYGVLNSIAESVPSINSNEKDNKAISNAKKAVNKLVKQNKNNKKLTQEIAQAIHDWVDNEVLGAPGSLLRDENGDQTTLGAIVLQEIQKAFNIK